MEKKKKKNQNCSILRYSSQKKPKLTDMKNLNNDIEKNGHDILNPGEITGNGWKDITKRVFKQINRDNATIVSAGVAFYFFLALIPAIAAIVSIYGLVVDSQQVEQQLSQIANFLPDQAYQLVSDILHQTVEKSQESLSWSLIISILFSLWSANKATSAVFEGVNIAYHETDDRSFLIKKSITLLFTLGVIITGIICIAFVVAFPVLIDKLGLSGILQTGLALVRWIILGVVIYLVLGLIYKIAPNRTHAKFRWIKPGAAIATVIWLAGSLLFSLYVNNFGSYDQTYGSIAAVIIMMLWFYLTGFSIILGAEINSETEHQTSADTTVGRDRPMGQRGAYYADRVVLKDIKSRNENKN